MKNYVIRQELFDSKTGKVFATLDQKGKTLKEVRQNCTDLVNVIFGMNDPDISIKETRIL